MYYFQPYLRAQLQNNNMSIIDFKRGDVDGDGVKDNVFLIGDKPSWPESPFIKNITLIVQNGRTNTYTTVPLQENAGYNPTIFLGDFNNDKIDDILISIDSGGSGGYAFYYIYSFINNIPKKIFDSELYNQRYTYDVTYRDFYEVEVKEENSSNKYILNIEYKGKEYLSEIYDANGKLKEPISGWVNPLGGLYPVDFQRNGTYGLYATQRIAGRYNADGLGYVQNSLVWNGKEFAPFFQTLGIFGG